VRLELGSPVRCSDGNFGEIADVVVGHVGGLLVDADEQIAQPVLEHGHLWGHREVTIPIGAITKVETDKPTTVQRW
jgi:hypothetical protein